MRVVGITGRSGCGKSSATNFLREQGYPCIDADLVAREVLLPGSACIPQLQAAFGTDIADENGEVRRRLLADRAFATPEGTAALTAITQPEILRRRTPSGQGRRLPLWTVQSLSARRLKSAVMH